MKLTRPKAVKACQVIPGTMVVTCITGRLGVVVELDATGVTIAFEEGTKRIHHEVLLREVAA